MKTETTKRHFLPRIGFVLKSDQKIVPRELDKTQALYFTAKYNRDTGRWYLDESFTGLKCLIAKEQKELARNKEIDTLRVIKLSTDKKSVICYAEL